MAGASGSQASPTWQSYATDISPTASTYMVSGLRPAHAYQFQVSAVNVVGRGEASAPSRVIRLPEQRKYYDLQLYANAVCCVEGNESAVLLARQASTSFAKINRQNI